MVHIQKFRKPSAKANEQQYVLSKDSFGFSEIRTEAKDPFLITVGKGIQEIVNTFDELLDTIKGTGEESQKKRAEALAAHIGDTPSKQEAFFKNLKDFYNGKTDRANLNKLFNSEDSIDPNGLISVLSVLNSDTLATAITQGILEKNENAELGLIGGNSVDQEGIQYPSIGFECELRRIKFMPKIKYLNPKATEFKLNIGDQLFPGKKPILVTKEKSFINAAPNALHLESDNTVEMKIDVTERPTTTKNVNAQDSKSRTYPELVSKPFFCKDVKDGFKDLLVKMREANKVLVKTLMTPEIAPGLSGDAITVLEKLKSLDFEFSPSITMEDLEKVDIKMLTPKKEREFDTNPACQITYTMPVKAFLLKLLNSEEAARKELVDKYIPTSDLTEEQCKNPANIFASFLKYHYSDQSGFKYVDGALKDEGGKKATNTILKSQVVKTLAYFGDDVTEKVLAYIKQLNEDAIALVGTEQMLFADERSLSQEKIAKIKSDLTKIGATTLKEQLDELPAVATKALPYFFYRDDTLSFGPYKSHEGKDLIIGIELRQSAHPLIKSLQDYIGGNEDNPAELVAALQSFCDPITFEDMA